MKFFSFLDSFFRKNYWFILSFAFILACGINILLVVQNIKYVKAEKKQDTEIARVQKSYEDLSLVSEKQKVIYQDHKNKYETLVEKVFPHEFSAEKAMDVLYTLFVKISPPLEIKKFFVESVKKEQKDGYTVFHLEVYLRGTKESFANLQALLKETGKFKDDFDTDVFVYLPRVSLSNIIFQGNMLESYDQFGNSVPLILEARSTFSFYVAS